MSTRIRQHDTVAAFRCLGGDCPDTCCKTWDMQLDDAHLALYHAEAPELLPAVMEGSTGPVMRRDAASGYCVKLVEGWCDIHRHYGDRFLGDACHFYPRVTRALGGGVSMTATLSCPEIARLALFENRTGYGEADVERLPSEIRDYAPEGLAGEAAAAIHDACLRHAAEAPSADRAVLGLISLGRSLANLTPESWEGAAPFLLRTVEGRLLPPEASPQNPARLLLFLVTVVHATGIAVMPRLRRTVEETAALLGVAVNWEQVALTVREGAEAAAPAVAAVPPVADEWLRRWLLAHLAMTQFPFAGHGADPFERAGLVAVKYALARLALAACLHAHGPGAPEAERVRAVQSIARILDHVGDPSLMLAICAEFGWREETGLNGLIAG